MNKTSCLSKDNLSSQSFTTATLTETHINDIGNSERKELSDKNSNRPSYEHRTRKQKLGQFGEEYSIQYLKDLGWTILDTNWHCRFGELDIVAFCPRPTPTDDPVIVFIEVKTRSSTKYGDPLESITAVKQSRIRKAAILWLAQHNMMSCQTVRFDAIGIVGCPEKINSLTHVRHVM